MNTYTDFIKILFEYWKEGKDAAKERLKLPIVPLYVTLLILTYWKPLSIYLFSKQEMEVRISKIETLYAKWDLLDHFANVLMLLVVSFFSAAIFPLLMWTLDSLLLKSNNDRKVLRNKGKNIDRNQELISAQHKYDQAKILSGNKEIEEYNQSMNDLKNSYEDRISNMESVSLQKENNLKSEVRNLQAANQQLDLKLQLMQEQQQMIEREYNYDLRKLNSGYSQSNKKILVAPEQMLLLKVFKNIQTRTIFAKQLILSGEIDHDASTISRTWLISLLTNDLERLFVKITGLTQHPDANSFRLGFDLDNVDDAREREFIVNNKIGILERKHGNTEFYNLMSSRSILFEMRQIIKKLAEHPKYKDIFETSNLDPAYFEQHYRTK